MPDQIASLTSGDIKAGQKVVLHKSAQVMGNIETGILVVEEGATFEGQIKMSTGSSSSSKAPLKAVDGGSKPEGSGASS